MYKIREMLIAILYEWHCGERINEIHDPIHFGNYYYLILFSKLQDTPDNAALIHLIMRLIIWYDTVKSAI